MQQQVKATRMELQKKKKNFKMAVRGHKLLKEKRDGLMQRFLGVVREARETRERVEGQFFKALNVFLAGSAYIKPSVLKESLSYTTYNVGVDISEKNIMGVRVPVFKIDREGNPYSYGLTETTGDLDLSLRLLDEMVPYLLELAEIEKAAQLLANEIEKTRRRVNALEYVMIPQLDEAIRYISMRLEEMERSNLTMLMKVKDIVSEDKTQRSPEAEEAYGT
jgi:V/A-type H+-transporting ATPase subunit D